MFNPQHYGLYFDAAQVQYAQRHRAQQPFASAFARLAQQHPLELLPLAQWAGFSYRLLNDIAAGERAVTLLRNDLCAPVTAPAALAQVAGLMIQAQCFELVRDHPAWTVSDHERWLAQYRNNVAVLFLLPDWPYVERLWLNALRLVAGVVLDDAQWFAEAVSGFERCIREDIHPEGYIRQAAVGPAGESLMRMLLAAQALVLTAEAARHAGVNLWNYQVRGVSALTPTPYLLYYYYYPEKWRWDHYSEGEDLPEIEHSGLEPEAVQALYRQHAGLWEMAQRQNPSKDRALLLDELRPVYDVWGGGLVTLSHAGEGKSRRFRFLG